MYVKLRIRIVETATKELCHFWVVADAKTMAAIVGLKFKHRTGLNPEALHNE